MGRLLVLRHAQSTWNATGRWQGWSDAPLSELGTAQARSAGRALAASGVAPAFVACSDLSRARRTAELIALELGYDRPLVIDPDLREQDLGDWNGLTREQIDARWPGLIDRRWAGEPVPGGEAGEHFAARSLAALRRLAPGRAEEAVVVTHGGVVMALERSLVGSNQTAGYSNLCGLWVEVRGAPPDVELSPGTPVDLLAISTETVTGLA